MKETLLNKRVKNGKRIYEWVIRNHPPIVWNLIAIIMGEHFLENDINPLMINDSTEFTPELVRQINSYLMQKYNSGLPVNLLS